MIVAALPVADRDRFITNMNSIEMYLYFIMDNSF
jgi:hypothetical protein